MSSRPVYRYVLRWRHLVNAYTRLWPGLRDRTVSNLAPYALGCLLSRVLNLVVAVLRDSISIDISLLN